jgi:hypothetical protein
MNAHAIPSPIIVDTVKRPGPSAPVYAEFDARLHGAPVSTVADLLEVLVNVDPSTRIEWAHTGPDECCDGHAHDITETWGHDAGVHATRHSVTVMIGGGSV